MAEGLLRQIAGDRFDVFSAGIEAASLRPEAVAAMKELGLDISTQRSKSVDEYTGKPFDVVVTTCDEAKEACPLFPGARRMLHWNVPDPAAVDGDPGDRAVAFRAAREMLRQKIQDVFSPG